MAMSGTVAGYWSTTYKTACWSFEWTAEATGVGQTTVSWNLYTKGRYESPTWLLTSCTFKLWYDDEYKYTKTFTDLTGSETSFSDKFRDSGSFVINHNTDGSGKFWVEMEGNIYEWETKKTECWQDLDTNYPTTACTAPTSVVITPTIQKPGGNIQISWSGAKNGIANAISKYQVWYKIGSGAWSQAYEVAAGSTEGSGSTIITLPTTATRGAYISACVRSIGAGGIDSGDKYSEEKKAWVNTKPSPPTYSATRQTIPGGKSATLTLYAGAANDTTQTAQVWYNINTSSTSGEKQYSSPLTITPSKDDWSTYYTVWTWDGVEYSDPITINFYGHKNPLSMTRTITNQQTITDCDHANASRGTFSYVTRQTLTITTNRASTTYKKYWFAVEYGTSANNVATRCNINTDWGDSNALTNFDVRNYLPTLSSNYYYKIKYWVKDNTEEIVGETPIYFVSRAPKLLFTYNSNSGVRENDQVHPNYYSSYLWACFEYDPAYNCITISKTQNGDIIGAPYYDPSYSPYSVILSNGTTVRASWVNIANYFSRGTTTDLYLAPCDYGSNKYYYQAYRQKVKEAKTRVKTLSNSTFSWAGTYYPFRLAKESEQTFSIPFLTEANKSLYGFLDNNGIPTVRITGKIDSYEGSTYTIPSSRISFNTNKLDVTLTNEQIYSFVPASNPSRDANKAYTMSITATFSNHFGDSVTYTCSKTIDFRESAPWFSTTSGNLYAQYESQFVNISNLSHLREGAKLVFNDFVCKSHHGNLTAQIQFLDKWYTLKLQRQENSITQGIDAYYTYKPKLEAFTTIGNISTDQYPGSVKVWISNDFGGTATYSFTLPLDPSGTGSKYCVMAQRAPQFAITKAEAKTSDSDSSKIELKCDTSLTDVGIWYPASGTYGTYFNYVRNNYFYVTLYYEIIGVNTQGEAHTITGTLGGVVRQNQTDNYSDLNYVKSHYNNQTINYDINLSGLKSWSKMRVYYKVSLRNYIGYVSSGTMSGQDSANTNTKTTTTDVLTVYNITPTVSYRKNKVGINYEFPQSDTGIENPSLVIKEHSSAKNVYFLGDNHTAYINLNSGAQIGFVYDCGSWG